VAATETFLLGVAGDSVVFCAFARCGDDRVYNWREFQMLVLLLVVLVVRVLFLTGEHALLVRMIAYYQRVGVTQVTHSTHRGGSLILLGDQLAGGGKAVGTTIGFKEYVRQLLGGATSLSMHVLILSIFVQVTFWFLDFKARLDYGLRLGQQLEMLLGQ
jgi:hypothetical protein